MNIHKGFGLVAVLVIIAGILIVGGGVYLATKSGTDVGTQTERRGSPEEDAQGTNESITQADIHWKFDDAGERDFSPYTLVSVQVGETMHEVGTYQGTCGAVGSGGTIDNALLAGEISAAQCYWGGGGIEIGVFATEDGGLEIMEGSLDEGSADLPGFRGNFKVRSDLSL